MESPPREKQRREVRASVHRICLRWDDAAELVRNGLSEAQTVEALVSAGVPADDVEARRWCADDLASFGQALLVTELVSRRIGSVGPEKKSLRRSRPEEPVAAGTVPRRSGTPSVADLLDGMLAQERKG